MNSLLIQKACVIGTCTQMCPESEIILRENERMLHPLEILRGTTSASSSRPHKPPKADRNKMVKEFCRSAAGQHMQKENVLRPYHVLLDTIGYLLDEVITNGDFPWITRYDFIGDRLRAVRQDMIIQDLPPPQAISLLQPMVRFYAFASYKLCNEKIQNYDPNLNGKHLQECLKRLLIMYDDCEDVTTRCISNKLANIDYSTIYADVRAQIEAIYILFNMGDGEAISRGLNLPDKWKLSPEVQAALRLSLHYRNNNYVRVCKLMDGLPHLLAAIAVQHLPKIRRKCFEIMSTAYSSKQLKFPIGKLQRLLLYSNVGGLVDDLKHFNVDCVVSSAWDDVGETQGDVQFLKSNFIDNAHIVMRHEHFVDVKVNAHCISDIVLYGLQK